MGRKIKTIFEYLTDYSEDEILDVIQTLKQDELGIILSRYGNDLHNPIPAKNRPKNDEKFYALIKKMGKLLAQSKFGGGATFKN